MLEKYLNLLKIANFNEYKRELLNDVAVSGHSKLTFSIDHIYVRSLLMLLIKVGRPSYGDPLTPL